MRERGKVFVLLFIGHVRLGYIGYCVAPHGLDTGKKLSHSTLFSTKTIITTAQTAIYFYPPK